MAGRSSCPECGTILRIRDRSFVGRKFSCPECKTVLRIEATDRQDEFVARRFTKAETAAAESPAGKTKINLSKTTSASNASRRSLFRRVIGSPLTVGFLIAIATASLAAVLLFNARFPVTSARILPVRKNSEESVELTQPIGKSSPDAAGLQIVEIPAQHNEIGQSTSGDEVGSLSALEPANVEGPLPWPPIPLVSEMEESPVPPQPIPAKIDVEGKMAQKVVSYKQPKVSRRDLIEALEEQLGAPIRYDSQELGTVGLDEKVAFELENTTIGEVIQTVVDAAGWQVNIEETGIRLTKKNS